MSFLNLFRCFLQSWQKYLPRKILRKYFAQEKGRCQLSSSCYNGAKKLPQVLSEIYWSGSIAEYFTAFLTHIWFDFWQTFDRFLALTFLWREFDRDALSWKRGACPSGSRCSKCPPWQEWRCQGERFCKSELVNFHLGLDMRMCDQFRCHQVADFGLSKGKGEATDNEAFPILWSPPEVTTNPIVSLTCSFW